MKLLGWMHRKVKHNSTESLKTFSIENSAYFPQTSFDEQRHHAEPIFSYACSRKLNMKCQNFLIDIKANSVEEISEEESFDEVFQGFLAIGTLGVESLNMEPPTPTFPKTFEDITHEEMEITENDFKLINDKLEKFLEAEAEEVNNKTSERSSNASIVTIINNQIEDVHAEDYATMSACPLQKYLFGSSVELSKTEVQMKKEKISLGELFKRITAHEHHEGKYEIEEKQVKKRYVTHFMKKMLKKLHSTSRTSKALSNGDAGHSASAKRKLPKVLKIFHRRVHPEELMAEEKLSKSYFNKIGKIFCKCGYQEGEHEENTTPSPRANTTKEINSLELSSSKVSSVTITATGEHWIKTDDDYLVLEL